MRLTDLIRTFVGDEAGAVTVDWVVLTAAIVGLGIAVIGTLSSGVGGLGGGIERSLSSATINPINLSELHGGDG